MSPVCDAVIFTLNEVDADRMKLGRYLNTERRDVPDTGGLNKWWIQYYPAGYSGSDSRYFSIHLHATKAVKIKVTISVARVNLPRNKPFSHYCSSVNDYGHFNIAPHHILRRHFRDGKITIKCVVEFETVLPFVPAAPTVFDLFEDAPTDTELVVASDHLPVHKHFLSLISPVFRAMFANDTLESQTGKVVITDFDFAAVKTAIDYCYGREWKILSPDTYVDVLRFADKYMIKALTKTMEEGVQMNLSPLLFFDFLQYAVDFSSDTMLTECHTYFKAHQNELKSTNKFASLPIPTLVILFKAAFNLQTKFDVLRHAHSSEMSPSIIDRLEAHFLTTLALDEFSATVEYAWEHSREELQKTCAQFLTDNRLDVTTDETFLNLPSDLIKNVLMFSSKL